MGFQLNDDESVSKGIKRLARRQMEQALEALGQKPPSDEAVQVGAIPHPFFFPTEAHQDGLTQPILTKAR